MKSSIFGHTSTGLPIPAFHFGREGQNVLILGGVHGDEPEGVECTWGLYSHWLQNFSFRLRITLVPMLNVDGVLRKQRMNARGVDLNRNLPTNDWTKEVLNPRYNPGPAPLSEPENQAIVKWIETNTPTFVLSLHSWQPMLNTNGDCAREAQVIREFTGYEIKPTIGYPTPGCLGTYCGLERGMPTLTYEIERGLETQKILKIHVPAIHEALKVTESTRRESF